MKQLLVLISFLTILNDTWSQTNVGIKTVDITADKAIDERRIQELAYGVLNSEKDRQKDSLNILLKATLEKELSKSAAFSHSFEKVESISILTPEDSAFRIFNWNVPYQDGTFKFEMGILTPTLQLTYIDQSDSISEWVPALYYSIIPKQTKFQTYYTLLGWKGNNRLTTKKLIDVLWFKSNGEFKFGAPLFAGKKESKNKVIFEFAAQNTMQLRYNPKLDRIEFDHLSPPRQSLSGIYEYYGPDLSFDAYQWENEKWILKEEIDPDQGLKKKKSDFTVDPKTLLELEEKPIYSPK